MTNSAYERARPERWAHVAAAAGLLVFNFFGLPIYPDLYDKALAISALTIWTAWGWDAS